MEPDSEIFSAKPNAINLHNLHNLITFITFLNPLTS